MNIALIGYGKMGQAVEKIAHRRGHNIVFAKSVKPTINDVKNADVAIEFSTPTAAFANIKICLDNNIPVVCGTTGWLEKREEIEKICKTKKGTFLYASNFSIGMNFIFEINRKVAKLIYPYTADYNVLIEEIHHSDKLDIPSGTAISIAEDIIKKTMKKSWVVGNNKNDSKVPILVHRVNGVSGTHTICYKSSNETIKLTHNAHNRKGLAQGAIIAAEWIKEKKGIFSMRDVLGINDNKYFSKVKY